MRNKSGTVILRKNKADFEKEVDGLRMLVKQFQAGLIAKLVEQNAT